MANNLFNLCLVSIKVYACRRYAILVKGLNKGFRVP